MVEVAVRDLRNHGGEILERVARGEALTVTSNGHPIAELRPLPRRPIPAGLLLARWRGLPTVDPARMRADIDDVMIAATAMAHNLPVYTCNPADFAGIDGLTVVPVPVRDAS
jgi:prevent-host-death family protein